MRGTSSRSHLLLPLKRKPDDWVLCHGQKTAPSSLERNRRRALDEIRRGGRHLVPACARERQLRPVGKTHESIGKQINHEMYRGASSIEQKEALFLSFCLIHRCKFYEFYSMQSNLL